MQRRIWRRSRGVFPLLCRQCWLEDISIDVSYKDNIMSYRHSVWGGGSGLLTIFLGYCESIPGRFEAGACDDELGTADLPSSVDDTGQIVVVSLLSIVYTPEYGVG